MRRSLVLTLLGVLAFTPVTKAQQATSQPQASAPDPDAPRRVGGGVLPPILTKSVEPKYPHSFTGKRTNARVLVSIIVDLKGLPSDIRIVRSGGDNFDKSAVDAVSHYRFKPATENGQPVAVKINIDVNFQVIDKQ
jgi:TonB family protein